MSHNALFDARVRSMRVEATDILSLELVRADGGAWPDAAPGAHVDLQVPGVGMRQYSLLPSATQRSLWIGVQRDPATRGGSRWVHDSLRPAQAVRVGAPRNHFALEDGDAPVCLIAGGIGVTPLLAMAERLHAGTRAWTLHYCVRNRERLAFADSLARYGTHVRLHLDDEAEGPLDLAALVRAQPQGSHFYCCGPAPMLAGFASATAHLPPDQCHVEHFAPAAPEGELPGGSFVVELGRSGSCFVVPPDRSILDILLAEGLDIPHSCRNGVCGNCETRVLQGTPQHRDVVLSPQEKASGQTLMVCCSRAEGERLVLDL